MDPFTLMMGAGMIMQAAGTGMSIFGSNQANDANQQIAQLQMQQNKVRQTAMEVSARRQQTENLRNTQLQRAMAINSATNQGAQFGTGLQGGIAQVQNQGMWNAVGIGQSLDAGRQMFALDDQVNIQKQNLSSAQTTMSTGQGISSLGSSVMGAAGGMSKMSQGFGGATNSALPQTYGQFVSMINGMSSVSNSTYQAKNSYGIY